MTQVRGLKISGGVGVILLILVGMTYFLLPTIFKWQANSWFEAQGLDSQIGEVEINATDGQIIVRGASVDQAETNLLKIGHLLVAVSLSDLLANKLTIEKIDIGEGYLDIDRNSEGLMKVAGIVLGSTKEPGEVDDDPWQLFASEVLLSNVKVCYREEETPSTTSSYCGSLEAFEWKGSARYTFYPDSGKALSEMVIESSASLYGFVLEDLLSKQTMARIDSLHIDGVTAVGTDNVKVNNVSLDRLGYLLTMQGEKVSESKTYELSIQQLNTEAIVVKDLHEVHVASLNVGKTGLSMQADPESHLDVMRFDKLNLNGISMSGIDQMSFDQVDLTGYQALQIPVTGKPAEQENFIFSSKRLNANKFSINHLTDINVENLNVAGLDMMVVYNRAELFDVQNAINRVSPPLRDQSSEVVKNGADRKPDSRPVSIKIAKLTVDDGSRVSFRDESVKPIFKTRLDNIQLTLKDIDTVDVNSKTQVDLSMVVGEHGKINASGVAMIFDDRPSLDVDARLSGVNISDFDVYANRLIRHKVKSGHLDAKLDVKIDKGQMDSQANVTLHKFYIEESEQVGEDQYKESLGIPLSTALSLLRNRDDSIKIKVPVTGDVENPDFSLGDVIRKFSALAIKEAVIHYYTPFGLVKLLTAGYDLATALRFEPVIFENGQSGISDKDKKQLDKLAALMTERPNIHLVVCGYTSRDDFSTLFPGAAKDIKKWLERNKKQEKPQDDSEIQVLEDKVVPIDDKHREKLVELAAERGKVVKQYLVEQHNISPDRLILCNPKFDYADTGKARTEISI
ncbi:DUF748 domain-containing protein [Kaarinaea lacus]